MNVQEIIVNLKEKFGNSIDVATITEKLKGFDHKNMSMSEIIAKLKGNGLFGDLDGDGVQESAFEEIKGKATEMIGGFFHH